MTDNEAISRATIHEVYFDLWGYSWGWVERIQNTILDYTNIVGSGEVAETYQAVLAGGVGAKFQSQDKSRVDDLIKKVNSLLALAQKTYVKVG